MNIGNSFHTYHLNHAIQAQDIAKTASKPAQADGQPSRQNTQPPQATRSTLDALGNGRLL